MSDVLAKNPGLEGIGNYEFGWSDKNDVSANSRRGLSEEVVRDISSKRATMDVGLATKGSKPFRKETNANLGFRFNWNFLRHNQVLRALY